MGENRGTCLQQIDNQSVEIQSSHVDMLRTPAIMGHKGLARSAGRKSPESPTLPAEAKGVVSSIPQPQAGSPQGRLGAGVFAKPRRQQARLPANSPLGLMSVPTPLTKRKYAALVRRWYGADREVISS